jgi:hypothetical protein
MKSILLVLPLLSAISAHQPQVEPWRRVAIEGTVIEEDASLILFGAGEKELCVVVMHDAYGYETYERLAFGSVADYKRAETMIGSVVKIDGYLVRRGGWTWTVPISMSAKVE